jgi:hypothetical protein
MLEVKVQIGVRSELDSESSWVLIVAFDQNFYSEQLCVGKGVDDTLALLNADLERKLILVKHFVTVSEARIRGVDRREVECVQYVSVVHGFCLHRLKGLFKVRAIEQGEDTHDR